MAKKFELNRKEYLKIKKMDHNQMSLWAESMYRRKEKHWILLQLLKKKLGGSNGTVRCNSTIKH